MVVMKVSRNGDGFLNCRCAFVRTWTPLRGDPQAAVEPGHQFEWGWLLIRWGRLSGRNDGITAGRRLVEIGELHGVDVERGLAINELETSLSLRDPRARLWPQTERIKGNLAVASLNDADAKLAIVRATAAAVGLLRYGQHPIEGCWWEHIGPDDKPIVEPTRASSLYHIVCAMEELRSFLAHHDRPDAAV